MDITRALAIQGWMEPFELEWLAQQAEAATRVCEIGSWKGRSARALGDHCPGTVFVVDNWQGPSEPADETNLELLHRGADAIERDWHRNLEDLLESGRIVLVRGRSADVVDALRHRAGALMDLVFIDADHSFQGCLGDILTYEPMVRPGGILAGHDYTTECHPGVREAVDRYYGGRVRQGPGSIWWVRQ